MAKKMNMSNLPWFPFYTAAWLGSSTVTGMTMTERGIYSTLMAMCWQYGEIEWDATVLAKMLYIDRRTVVKWMDKYEHLTTTLQSGSRKRVLPKLQEFAETLGKSEGRKNTEERRGNEKDKGETTPALPSVPKQVIDPSKAGASAPPKEVFNPLTYEGGIASSKSDTVYDSPLVKRILYFHFKLRPSDFWAGRIISEVALAKHIDTMHQQMLNDVGQDWEIPAPKPPKPVRPKGNPDCRNCYGRGLVSVRSATDLSQYAAPCDCTIGAAA